LTRSAPLPSSLVARVEALEARGLRRTLPPPTPGLDLCSNDTLGFATDPVLRARFAQAVATLPLGGTASRLVRAGAASARDLTAEAEAALARLTRAEATLLLPSGFQANAALFGALLGPRDVVFSDALNHASIIDALRTTGARRVVYPHGDVAALDALMVQNAPEGSGERYLVTESVFSMDGDHAPLAALVEVAGRHAAHVVVDEAHATGLWGGGAGCVVELDLRSQVLATVHTGGKALGVGGGFIAGSAALRDALTTLSRAFIYSTGVTPALACALRLSTERYAEVGAERAAQALALGRYARDRLSALPGVRVPPGLGPIVPVLLGEAARTMRAAERLRFAGFDMRGFRPPTVPEGTSRLRLVTRAALDRATIDAFANALAVALTAR
jgi:8-amino-7-oxononanoate synthase